MRVRWRSGCRWTGCSDPPDDVIPGCAPLGAQARNPYSRSWLWIPGSCSARPGMTKVLRSAFFAEKTNDLSDAIFSQGGSDLFIDRPLPSISSSRRCSPRRRIRSTVPAAGFFPPWCIRSSSYRGRIASLVMSEPELNFPNSIITQPPSHSRGAIRPGYANCLCPFETKRAQGMPGARCTRGLVCKQRKRKRTRAYRFSGGIPTSPAQWFYGLFRALPGERIRLVAVASGLKAFPARSGEIGLRGLGTSNGCQDHTASPYAIRAVVSRAAIAHGVHPALRRRMRALATAASTTFRPAFHDDRDTPLSTGPERPRKCQ